MIRYLMLLVVFSLSYEGFEALPCCNLKIADSYLDIAVDMIGKAKKIGDSEKNEVCNQRRGALDCSELLQKGYNKSGVYTIWPVSRVIPEKSIEVFCDMQTDGGGWTVIQRRGNFQNPTHYFFKEWSSYKKGFGDIKKEFWLGNDNIFALSNQDLYSVRFDLRDTENETRFAVYDTFWIDNEDSQYMLHIDGYTGDADDAMTDPHNNRTFSTKDKDTSTKCAHRFKGGWWYADCYGANLNGLNLSDKSGPNENGMNWRVWKGNVSMESTEIKIRPKNFKITQLSLNAPM